MMTLSLGIDIGTSGIRTAVLDDTGQLISTARVRHEAQQDGGIDAELWWHSVAACIHSQAVALGEIGRNLSEIGRIGVDGTSGTMVLTDKNLTPVTQALMYNSSGFHVEAAAIAQHAPSVHITKGSNSALARALRLMAEDTDGRATYLLHQADFIIAKLRGQGGFSDHNNTLKLGYDPETERWPEWFEKTAVRMSILPKPLAAGAVISQIGYTIAKEFGFSIAARVHAGTTDSIAAFLAAAPLTQEAAVTSLGTTLAIKIISDARIDDPEIGLYSHKLGKYWLVGGASNTGGGVLASVFSPDKLTSLSSEIDPSQTSPFDYYPLLKAGERFPINDPDLPPRMEPRPDSDAAYLQGLLESIARIEAQCYGAIVERGGARPRQLFTAGGGARNETWAAIRTRVLGIRPRPAQHTEAAIGTARLINSYTN